MRSCSWCLGALRGPDGGGDAPGPGIASVPASGARSTSSCSSLRSTLLVAATLSFFGALRFLPIAEASSITFLAPVLVVLLSPWVLGERLRRSRSPPRSRASSAS